MHLQSQSKHQLHCKYFNRRSKMKNILNAFYLQYDCIKTANTMITVHITNILQIMHILKSIKFVVNVNVLSKYNVFFCAVKLVS